MTTAAGCLTRLDDLPAAQTSVELFNQLQRQHATDADLRLIRTAHGWAMSAFACRMHASGKPYLSHGIGAASVLAGCGLSADIVAAGLVHGAYRWGDFGPWRMSGALKRQRLARDLGARVEAHAYRFQTLPWSLPAVVDVRERLTTLDDHTRTVVLMRLASDLDNLRDRGLLFCTDAEQRREVIERKAPVLAELADRLGFPLLARALMAAAADTLRGSVPAALRWRHPSVALLAPASTQPRPAAVLTSTMHAGLQRLRHRR
jgi:(p)ppGpp synthase/HD superfamily hydrolase